MSQQALNAVAIAIKEIGTVEKPAKSNRQKYGEFFGTNGVPWCALFVSWVIFKTGLKLPRINYAYCPDWVTWFKKMGRYYPNTVTPQPGDIVFFAFTSIGIKNNWAEHIGIVEKVNKDGTITTIEGNTSAGIAGSQDNGDGVYRRVRSKPYITGYGKPFYN